MGVWYTVMPLDTQGELAEWLAQLAIKLPASNPIGRYPTPKELRRVLDSLENYTIKYHISPEHFYAHVYETAGIQPGPPPLIEGPSTMLIIPDFHGDEDNCYQFYFEKGWPELIVVVLERLARITGPLVLIPDVDPKPLIISAGADPEKLLRTWEHTAQSPETISRTIHSFTQ